MHDPRKLERVSTGAPGLDAVLGGGFPRRSMIVITGEPGAGKTVLALQAVFHAARAGRRCAYFTTLSEPSLKFLHFLQLFTFFDQELLDELIQIHDLGSALRAGDIDAAFTRLTEHVERWQPEIVVLDSFKAIHDLIRDPHKSRTFAYDVSVHMAGWGATTLLVGEYSEEERHVLPEFAVADGVIRLGISRQGLASIRELEVHKLRGSAYVSGIHYFDIGVAGFRFYPRVRVPEDVGQADASMERVAFGISGLDELVSGGVPVSSSTLAFGASGTGKTTLGLSFLLEGVRRGEPGVLLTLEETLGQIRRNAASIGLDLESAERAGLLHLSYTAPVELSTDRYLQDARDLVTRVGAKRVALDGLTSLSLGTISERRYQELVCAFAKTMRMLGVSLFATMETPESFGTSQITSKGMSYSADNLLYLRFVEMGGQLDRAISFLKARGIEVKSQVRRMTISREGVRVQADERLRAMRGILTGLPG